jgi:hypothetical protein
MEAAAPLHSTLLCVNDIRERAVDARLLWEHDRRQGALLLALVCVAVRAKLEHPEIDGDGARFEAYLGGRLRLRFDVEFRGAREPIERVFYKWMRCTLVHDAGLPEDVQFVDSETPRELMVRAGGAPEYVLLISTAWFDQLLEWALN